MGLELALFGLLALLAIVSAAAMIYQKNAVHSALFLILNFGCVALLFLMLDAPFISMVQIAVYAGAIMVLFLFVIMLLGAEQTTDTDARQFGWLTGAATVLGASLLLAMAIPLVLSGGLDLPEAPGANPQLRLVHAADIDSPVTIAVADNSFENIVFGDSTNFIELSAGAGDYVVAISDEVGTTIYETVLTLQPDQVVTGVAYGEDGIESIALIPSSLESSGDDQARFNVMNLYTDSSLYLVDLGSDAQLDVEDGEITDFVLAEGLAFAELAEPFTTPDGRYRLRFIEETADGEFEIVSSLGQWLVEDGTEQTLVLSPDYASVADNGIFRATVLDNELNINETFGAPGDIGGLLFIDYLLPVNLVGFLLLVALVGVIVLTRPEGVTNTRRSTVNRRRKVSRPLVNVISQQTGQDVVVDTPKLDEPSSGD